MVKVLFVCVHNSARSQIGETYLNDLGEGLFLAESAGIEKGSLNPYVIEVMREDGYDISENETNSVFEYYKEGRNYLFVIKVCDEMHGQKCPIFRNAVNNLYWNIEDPSSFEGTQEEILEKTRHVREEIKAKVIAFIEEHKAFARSRIA
jgi:arsenate reductase